MLLLTGDKYILWTNKVFLELQKNKLCIWIFIIKFFFDCRPFKLSKMLLINHVNFRKRVLVEIKSRLKDQYNI